LFTGNTFIFVHCVVKVAQLVFQPVHLLTEEERAACELLELDSNSVVVDLSDFDFQIDVAALRKVLINVSSRLADPLEHKFLFFGCGSELDVYFSQSLLNKLEKVLWVVS